MVAPLGPPVDDLFVRKNRSERRAPVDRHFSDVCKPLLVKLLEDPLRPAVVLWIGRVHLAIPVVAEAERAYLLAEAVDVLLRGDRGVGSCLDCILLRREAECVPSHRMKDVEAFHPLVAAEDIRRGVALGMADMKPRARGIRKHVEAVELLARCGRVGLECFVLQPALLPLLFDGREIVFAHYFCFWSSACSAMERAIRPETSFVAAATPALTA